MVDKDLYDAIDKLPEDKKEEVKDFVYFLMPKQEAKKNPLPKKRQFGCAKGFFQMREDFDEPLDDFKPYMEWDCFWIPMF